jgi:hypothetical protein
LPQGPRRLAREFRSLAEELDGAIKISTRTDTGVNEAFNRCLFWVSRCINPVAHSNAGPTEQTSMETFGATPFPRIQEITDLAGMQPGSDEFHFLKTKLLRQRNAVEDAFHQANELIRNTLRKAHAGPQ